MELIPPEKYPETPLYLLGTAGLRLLPEADQKRLTIYLYETLSTSYPFHLPQDSIGIISGKTEGVFSWIAVNYLLGKFSSHHSGGITTVGSLDMGGASLQIAFEIPADADVSPSNTLELDLGCGFHGNLHKHRVFLATYLGYGSNEIWRKYQKSLVELQMERDENSTVPAPKTAVSTPCLPLDLVENATLGEYRVRLKGSGNFFACRQSLLPFLYADKATPPCVDDVCLDSFVSPNVEYRHLEFYGLSEFWYSMHDLLRVGGDYSSAEFERAAKEFCETSWKTLLSRFKKNLYPTADIYRLKSQCLKSSWVSLIIHDGFGFPSNFTNFHAVSYVGSQRVQWPLGAILHHTRFLPLREIQQRTHNVHSVLSTGGGVAFVLPCLAVAVVALMVIVCSCWDRNRRFPRSTSVVSISKVVSQTLLRRTQSAGRLSSLPA